jgi:catechol 2,3-dioxygenase-like lactoylglutathione lyase family enzyme
MNAHRLVAFLPAADYGRARSFYVDQLGCEFISQDQFALVLRSGGNMVRITKIDNFKPGPHTVLGWEVSDIERAVAELVGKGIAFEKYPWVQDDSGRGIWTAPGGDRVAWFKDPDGNVLSLSQHVAR